MNFSFSPVFSLEFPIPTKRCGVAGIDVRGLQWREWCGTFGVYGDAKGLRAARSCLQNNIHRGKR